MTARALGFPPFRRGKDGAFALRRGFRAGPPRLPSSSSKVFRRKIAREASAAVEAAGGRGEPWARSGQACPKGPPPPPGPPASLA